MKVIGADNNDILRGAYTSDVIDAGLGDDTLTLTAGNDEYLYSKNDGNDVIQGTGAFDILKFIDLTQEDVLFEQSGLYDITIIVRDTQHVITLKNQLNKDFNAKIDQIIFADNSQLDNDKFLEIIKGTAEDDVLYGTIGNDHIEGFAGDDEIVAGDGNYGNSILNGGAGDDKIYGGSLSHNIITGGTGNDTLDGGLGKNTYIYNIGDGNDTIDEGTHSSTRDGDYNLSNNSTLILKGIQINDVSYSFYSHYNFMKYKAAPPPAPKGFETLSYGLNIFIQPTGENIYIRQQVNRFGEYAIDKIIFDDGTEFSALQIAQSVLAGTDERDVIFGTVEADIITGGEGGDQLIALGDGDTLFGGTGSDTLDTFHSYTTLDGGADSDTLSVLSNYDFKFNRNNILNGGA
ncbi:MAG: calcium-binding protein [Paracoccus sp. (in: a-proteobacteria)]